MIALEIGAAVVEEGVGFPAGAILPPGVREPYRLWSLSEIMNPFSPQVFLKLNMLIENLGHFAAEVSDQKLGSMTSVQRLKDRVRKSFEVEGLVHLCTFHGLTASRITAEKIDRLDASTPLEQLCNLVNELQGRLIDELAEPRFFEVSDGEAGFYNNPKGGWESTLDRFPSAIFDVEEASKCYGLARYTACVLHLNRVLEVGMDTLKIETGITSYSPTWKVALDQISKAVSVKVEKDKTPEERARDAFIRDAVHYLTTVKDAIRNPSTHKAEKTYTGETALEVYMGVRAFMRHLSTRIFERSVLDPEIPA
jgi:hypothetical protein